MQSHYLEGVKDRRQLLKLRAVDLAASLGMEPTSYRRLERGERRCYLDKAVTLAKELGCTLEQLSIIPTGDERDTLLRAGDAKTLTSRMTPQERDLAATKALLVDWGKPDYIDDDDDDCGNPPVPEPHQQPLATTPAPAPPQTPKPSLAVPQLVDNEERDRFIARWEAEEAEDDPLNSLTVVDADAPLEDLMALFPDDDENGSVVEQDDDEPDLPVDPMSKYVSTWSGDQ